MTATVTIKNISNERIFIQLARVQISFSYLIQNWAESRLFEGPNILLFFYSHPPKNDQKRENIETVQVSFRTLLLDWAAWCTLECMGMFFGAGLTRDAWLRRVEPGVARIHECIFEGITSPVQKTKTGKIVHRSHVSETPGIPCRTRKEINSAFLCSNFINVSHIPKWNGSRIARGYFTPGMWSRSQEPEPVEPVNFAGVGAGAEVTKNQWLRLRKIMLEFHKNSLKIVNWSKKW